MVKKITALVLSVLILCAAVPVTASASSDSLLKDEVFDEGLYYHLNYVKEQDFFEDDIDLYTALGLYDDAWRNYFTGEVDIDYATTILLALIEKVDVEYQNEEFEEILKLLKAASSVAEVIEIVNEYAGILDFAESAEWASSISTLNTIISVATYGNNLYKAFIDGYASILSARAASIYYSDLLGYIEANCENDAVKAAAADILENINSELEAAVKNLVAKLAKSVAQDAVDVGVSAAMASNTVTAAIKTAYSVATGLANTLFKTSSQYGYKCSLAEVYYIEDCMTPWVEEKLATADEATAIEDFALSAFLSIRETGETLVLGLALTQDATVAALAKDYDSTEIKVKTASVIAKLEVIRSMLKNGVSDSFTAIYTATGDDDIKIIVDGNTVYELDGDAEAPAARCAAGYVANIKNEDLGTFVKVFAVFGNTKKVDAQMSNPSESDSAYLQLDYAAGDSTLRYYAAVAIDGTFSITTPDLAANYSTSAPTIAARGNGGACASTTYSTQFVSTPFTLTFSDATVSEGEVDNSLAARWASLFSEFARVFKVLFLIFK